MESSFGIINPRVFAGATLDGVDVVVKGVAEQEVTVLHCDVMNEVVVLPCASKPKDTVAVQSTAVAVEQDDEEEEEHVDFELDFSGSSEYVGSPFGPILVRKLACL